MYSLILHVLAVCLVCLVGVFAIKKWSTKPDPQEEENHEVFDERVVYMKDYEYVWRKKKVK